MAALIEAPKMGDILKYELEASYSREVVTLLTGTNYAAGSVLGRITASGKYKLSTATGSDGAQTAVAVLLFAVDASDGDQTGVILARGPAIVSRGALVVDATVDDGTKLAAKHSQLAAAGIVARDTA